MASLRGDGGDVRESQSLAPTLASRLDGGVVEVEGCLSFKTHSLLKDDPTFDLKGHGSKDVICQEGALDRLEHSRVLLNERALNSTPACTSPSLLTATPRWSTSGLRG